MPLRAPTRVLVWLAAACCAALVAWWLAFRAGGRSSPTDGPAPHEPAAREAAVGPLLSGVGRSQPRNGAARRPDGRAEGPAVAGEVLLGPEPPALRLRVEAFDVRTGRELRGTWSPKGEPPTAGPHPRHVTEDPEAFAHAMEQERVRALERERDVEASFLALGATTHETLEPAWLLYLPLWLRLEPGWVALDAERISAYVAADAREAVARIQAAPEALLDLVVTAPDGTPAEGVWLDAVKVGRAAWKAHAEERGPGRLHVRGLPHLPGEPVHVALGWEPERPTARAQARADGSPWQVETAVPTSLALPWAVSVRLDGPSAGLTGASGETDCDTVHEEDLDPPADAWGSVSVRVLGRDGQPVPGAQVRGQRTDRDGQVVLRQVVPGRHTFRAGAVGRLHASGTVEVLAGREVGLVVREPEGARLEVRVVDASGHPRPGARLDLPTTTWFDVSDGVQRMDLVCDRNGERAIARAQPGSGRLMATWLGRRAEVDVRLHEGETTRVTLVVP